MHSVYLPPFLIKNRTRLDTAQRYLGMIHAGSTALTRKKIASLHFSPTV